MPVSLGLGAGSPGPMTVMADAAAALSVDDALSLAFDLGHQLGASGTRDLWEALATIAATDLGAARAVEPHLDAIAILQQSGHGAMNGTWGVFAAEGGDDPLCANHTESGWMLSGTKPWCSLAQRLDRALVTASGRLFAVDLRQAGVRADTGAWVARGLVEIPSGPVRFESVPAEPVGGPGWYLERPGFAWGGIGVAACWYGGAVGVARSVFEAASRPNPFLLAHLGAIDELLQSARRALAEAVVLVDAGDPGGRILAKRVRATVARACEEILERAGHALGPAPLALDGPHSKRVADLQLYLRQHHAERDQASLGQALADGPRPW